MSKVSFFNGVQPLIQRATELSSNTKMSNSERATKTIELQRDEMKFFMKDLQDNMLGNKIDILG
jgi:hypothetical protein